MKTVMTGALALVLLAGTAGVAMAQDRAERDHDTWHDAGERPRPPQRDQWRQQQQQQAPRQAAPQAQAQPQARPQAQIQPQQQPQAGPGGWRRGADGRTWRGADGQRRDGGQTWTQPAPAIQSQPAAPPAARDQRRDNRWDGQRRDDRHDDRRDDRRDDRSRDTDRRDRNDGRSWNDNRDWQWRGGDYRQDRPRYDPRSYPRAWHSPQRYRGYNYRPPPGFYVRSWAFGDFLPRTWWTPDYRLNNWWDYGLPIPPIGYEWVRVGDDALLVDVYTGRVVQVAYDIFW